MEDFVFFIVSKLWSCENAQSFGESDLKKMRELKEKKNGKKITDPNPSSVWPKVSHFSKKYLRAPCFFPLRNDV